MEKNLNEQEKLELINEMIVQARGNVQKGAGNVLLFVGYALVFTSLLVAALYHVLTPPWAANWAWMVMFPVTFIAFYMGNRQERKAFVRTHLDRIGTKIWVAFVCALMITQGILLAFAGLTDMPEVRILITPLTLVLTAAAQYVSGTVFRYRPMTVGGIILWVAAAASFAVVFTGMWPSVQMVVFAAGVAGGFIVPGHLLNRKSSGDV
jgi:hypothetical protein